MRQPTQLVGQMRHIMVPTMLQVYGMKAVLFTCFIKQTTAAQYILGQGIIIIREHNIIMNTETNAKAVMNL